MDYPCQQAFEGPGDYYELEEADILKEFVGYEGVVLSYEKLKEVVEKQALDRYELWRNAFSNVKAVYLILDTKNGQQYVGSAYGNRGLLERWECYADIFHVHSG